MTVFLNKRWVWLFARTIFYSLTSIIGAYFAEIHVLNNDKKDLTFVIINFYVYKTELEDIFWFHVFHYKTPQCEIGYN